MQLTETTQYRPRPTGRGHPRVIITERHPVMFRSRFILAAAAVGTGALVTLMGTSTAQAHTPVVSATCDGVTVTATNYGSLTGEVVVKINGETVGTGKIKGGSYGPVTFEVPQNGEKFSYQVDIDTEDGTYELHQTGKEGPCGELPPPPSSTPPSSSPPSESTPPSSPPSESTPPSSPPSESTPPSSPPSESTPPTTSTVTLPPTTVTLPPPPVTTPPASTVTPPPVTETTSTTVTAPPVTLIPPSVVPPKPSTSTSTVTPPADTTTGTVTTSSTLPPAPVTADSPQVRVTPVGAAQTGGGSTSRETSVGPWVAAGTLFLVAVGAGLYLRRRRA